MSKVKIKFTETRVVDDEYKGTPDQTVFIEGKTYTLEDTSAQHWLSRGAAVQVGASRPKKPKPPKPDPDKTDKDKDDENKDDTVETGDGDGDGDGQTTQ